MNFADRTLVAALTARLEELAAVKSGGLLDGLANDYADYKGRVGYLRAIRDVQAAITTIMQDVVHGHR